eukprot:g7472.t1
MQSVSRTRPSLLQSTTILSPRGRTFTTKAVQTSKWDVEVNGPLTAKNVQDFYRKQGYLTAHGLTEAGCRYGSHTHIADGWMAVISGQYTIQFDGQKLEMEAGDMCEIPGDMAHEEYIGDEIDAHLLFATKSVPLLIIGLLFQASNDWKAFVKKISNKVTTA